MNSKKPEIANAGKAEYNQIRQQFLQRYGVKEVDSTIANPKPKERPALGTFLK
jgi:hypothetical protein